MRNSKIKVAEMFAGVGGFHLGLRKASKNYEVIWANQYEPAITRQFAFNIYEKNFKNTIASNEDISKLNKSIIPDVDLLVGGFPCQDYSVASSGAEGLYGKKGVLWWDIKDVIEEKWPQYIFLENVDRLLTSPGVKSNNPGRDFGMMLRTLSDLGYGVSWKMINAADYGFPQRRRRTFIFAFREDTVFKNIVKKSITEDKVLEYLQEMPPFSSSLKNKNTCDLQQIDLNQYKTLIDFSDKFKIKRGFRKTGIMIDGQAYTADYEPELRDIATLESIIKPNEENESLYLTQEKIDKFKQLKNGFQTIKTSKTGHSYKYGMGKMVFPDPINLPARTMVTSEHTVSRMSHVVKDPGNKRLRVISPQEAELINTFPPDWTKLEGVTESNRYFTMGNALVVDLVKEIAIELEKIINSDNKNSDFRKEKIFERIEH
ncbi:DNA cytosine methyltransferase [uncultured Vagococcus sp.]|uniref:DNA cytosine methyltransferase n=1 Tax=uncultured Vagococcus sp. TaxID=189676 RepID=UPI002590BA49|nr:DNA (cytosine-5-)-methyltransferase [uncultured Vagococcus sp.]